MNGTSATAIRDATVIAAYIRDGLSIDEAGARARVSRATAHRILIRHGIPRRPASRPRAGMDEQQLIDAYTRERLTMDQCADRFGIGRATVSGVLRRNGVPRRPPGWQRIDVDEGELTDAWRRGWPATRCAGKFGVSPQTIRRILRRNGVPLGPRTRPAADVDEDDLVRAYAVERLSLHQCEARFRTSSQAVKRILERHGIPVRPPGRPPGT